MKKENKKATGLNSGKFDSSLNNPLKNYRDKYITRIKENQVKSMLELAKNFATLTLNELEGKFLSFNWLNKEDYNFLWKETLCEINKAIYLKLLEGNNE